MTRILIPVVALLTLALLVAWLYQGPLSPEALSPTVPTLVQSSESPEPPAPPIRGEVPLPAGFTELKPAVERRISFGQSEEVLTPDTDYVAVIETERGVITIELLPDAAPITVNNFVFLALNRYYDGIVFHRVIDGFMAQTGDPTGSGTGGPGYTFGDEVGAGLSHDAKGIVSMANAGPGTNGSQFFITFEATPWLDGAHTIFGRVIDGSEVLDLITRVDPSQPSAVALLDESVQSLRDQGFDLPGEGSVAEALEQLLGVAPVPGNGYDLAGGRVVVGSVSGQPAVGFFPNPDRMQRVSIGTRAR
jgi:cyclophilin family peptidyl-prolyl cis-trans isomerase